jgi:hypothetical protein
MATKRGDNVATGTKAPAKPPADVPETNEPQQGGGDDAAALRAELAELRGLVAGLTAGLGAAQASAPRAKQDVEPGQDDPRRNIPEEGFEPVAFRAKGRRPDGGGGRLRVVRVPATRWTTLNGEAQHAGGISYDFAPGDGEFLALNSNVAEFLRTRPMFNVGFWEVGNEPHSAPDPARMLDKVQTALMSLDLDALDELWEQEVASHGRKIVLDQINGARRKIKAA